MTNEQIRQLTDTIYRALFDADGAALRIRLRLPPAAPDDITDDDLRDEMGELALAHIGLIEDSMSKLHGFLWEDFKATLQNVSQWHGDLAKRQAAKLGIDLLTGQKKDEIC